MVKNCVPLAKALQKQWKMQVRKGAIECVKMKYLQEKTGDLPQKMSQTV